MLGLVGHVRVEAWEGAFKAEEVRGCGHPHVIKRVYECTGGSSKGTTKTFPSFIDTSEECGHDGIYSPSRYFKIVYS